MLEFQKKKQNFTFKKKNFFKLLPRQFSSQFCCFYFFKVYVCLQVVSQVVESEKSQRLLLSECNSLRQQVQQLANNNRKLKEQHLLNPSQLSSSSAAEKGILNLAIVKNVAFFRKKLKHL